MNCRISDDVAAARRAGALVALAVLAGFCVTLSGLIAAIEWLVGCA